MASATFGATSTFVQVSGTSGTWNASTSWADGDLTTVPTTGGGHVPNGVGDVAVLQQLVSTNGGNVGITLGTQITLSGLTIRNSSNLFTTALQTGGSLVFDNGSNPVIMNEAQGGPDTSTGRTRINAPVTLNSNLIVQQDQALAKNTVTEFVQQITAGPSITLTKTGMGSLQFAYGGTSDGFQGNVDIQQGDIRLIDGTANVTSVFNQAAGILVENGTQFQLGNKITNFNIAPGAEVKINGVGNTSNTDSANLFTDGALRFENSALFNTVCNFNSPVRMQTTSKIYVTASDVTGVLTQELRGDGTAGLIKGGDGVLKLSTTSANGNPYAGNTTISKGTLVVNNTVSTASGVGSGNVNVTDTGSGATLGGTGFIGTSAAPSNITLTSNATSGIGARLFPGDLTGTTTTTNHLITAPGTLTVHGNITFDALSSLNVDITGTTAGTQYDQIAEHGTVTLSGAGLNVNLGTYVPTGSETFTLIDNFGAQTVSGAFGSLNGVAGDYSEGAAVTLGSALYHITYDGGATHNDVMLIGGAAPVGVPGDFNGNGVVDAADYVLWRAGGPLQNEVSDQGTVTPQDYLDWKARFGNTSGAGSGSSLSKSGAVPEPSTLMLLTFALSAVLVKSRKR
jgi:hypothetical protein